MDEKENPAGSGGASGETAAEDVSHRDVNTETIGEVKRAVSGGGTPYAAPVTTLAAVSCDEYLSEDNLALLRHMSTDEIRDGLLGLIWHRVDDENLAIKRGHVLGAKRQPPTRLAFPEVARLLMAMEHVRMLRDDSRGQSDSAEVLAVYDSDPTSRRYGTYLTSDRYLRRLARQYAPDISTKEFGELKAALEDLAPRQSIGTDRDMIAVGNGIVDYRTGELRPFSPEHVFLSKIETDYHPDAQSPVIVNPDDGTEWEIESWMAELSDDPEVVELLWHVIGAVCRPHVSWNKSAWFYSEVGNNGKGTLVALMRNLLGTGNWISLSLSAAGGRFGLSELLDAGLPQAILTDENDVGIYLDKAAGIKALITGDALQIEGKGTNAVTLHWPGFMVQCINEFPRVRDRSPSFLRRLLLVPFEKSFAGIERRYIKDDYLARPEVLAYVLRRVLDHELLAEHYELPTPEVCDNALGEFREHNDPVMAFWTEMKEQLVWDLVPFIFLFDLYKSWLAYSSPSAKVIGRNNFTQELVALVRQEPGGQWECTDRSARHRPAGRMSEPEPLIVDYELENWMSTKKGTREAKSRVDPNAIKDRYAGLMRKRHYLVPGVLGDEGSE